MKFSSYAEELVQEVEAVGVESRRSVDERLACSLIETIRQEILIVVNAWPIVLSWSTLGRHRESRFIIKTSL